MASAKIRKKLKMRISDDVIKNSSRKTILVFPSKMIFYFPRKTLLVFPKENNFLFFKENHSCISQGTILHSPKKTILVFSKENDFVIFRENSSCISQGKWFFIPQGKPLLYSQGTILHSPKKKTILVFPKEKWFWILHISQGKMILDPPYFPRKNDFGFSKENHSCISLGK